MSERESNLFEVVISFELTVVFPSGLRVGALFFELGVRLSDFAGELFRPVLMLASDVPVPVVVVITEGSLEASRRDGCGPIQDAGVWQSTDTVTFFETDLTAEAYDGAAEDEGGDEDATSLFASPYERPLSVLMRWISFSCIQIGQDLEDAQWSPLQFRQQVVSAVHSLPSWPSWPHFQHASGFLQNRLECPNF